ncbi:MAG: PAS domain S-box protein [Pseudomonadota bacterium]
MEHMHSLLKRQIKRYLSHTESFPREWDAFVNAVNDAYWQIDMDREMLERSLDLSSDELFEANSEMRAIFEAIPDLLFRLDGSGMILDCKAGVKIDFIVEPKKMIGKRIQDVPAKSLGDQFRNALDRLRAQKSVVSMEYSLTLHGREQFYEARLAPFLGNQIIVIIRSITERIRAEGERKRLVTAIEQSAEGIYLVGTDWIIQYVNPAFERITGYDKDELVGRHARLLKSGRHDRAFYRNIKETLARGDIWSGRALDRKKDGSLFDVDVTVSPVRNQSGTAINYVAIHRDISHIVKLEKQLSQAQKLEAVGTLAGGIAHDFNNLLMGILGYASLMLLDIDNRHPHYEKLKAIETQAKSGADLTRQLLGVARAGRYEVKPTNLNELIHKTASLFGRTKKEIRIHEKYDASPWNVDCDRGQIEQVLLNLFVNAWQAMPGGGEIYLETRNIDLDESYTKPFSVVPGRYIKISVTDTGTGMDEKTQARIFDPFFTTKEMGRGTGLGLASAYGIVKGHAGLINVYSERGHGTTFNIYLPASNTTEAICEAEPFRKIIRGHETILLVDDEPLIAAVAGEMLEGLGHQVLAAVSGREAIVIYKANFNKIDLVILDMIMPDMGGGETYLALKSINPGIKAILSSGYSINGEAKTIMDQGVDAFLQKPFNMKDLSRKIRDVLDH